MLHIAGILIINRWREISLLFRRQIFVWSGNRGQTERFPSSCETVNDLLKVESSLSLIHNGLCRTAPFLRRQATTCGSFQSFDELRASQRPACVG